MVLTLRFVPNGHVLPERVETDLPAAVEAVHRAGLEVPMITTEIMSVDTPHAEAVLKNSQPTGHSSIYRWGWFTYLADKGIAERLNELKPQVKALADLNKKHQICGMYHTHSGPGLVGGAHLGSLEPCSRGSIRDGLESTMTSVTRPSKVATAAGSRALVWSRIR